MIREAGGSRRPKMFRWLRLVLERVFHHSASLEDYYRDLLFKPIEEIPYHRLQEFSVQLGALVLSWALGVLPNYEKALRLQRVAIKHLTKAGPTYQEKARQVVLVYLKAIPNVDFRNKALQEIFKEIDEDYECAELLSPIIPILRHRVL
jgi:hypothetical protein